MESELVSVITITRNRGKLIGRCIESVLNQTYKNIEHIIVDGASTDETDSVVSSYNDNRLRYIKLETNWSVVDSINYAVSLSKGYFISFLDSDDEYLPTKIERQVFLIKSLPPEYGMVYCWMTYYDSAKDDSVVRLHNTQLRGYVPLEAAEKPSVSGTPTFLFKKRIFEEMGGWDLNAPIVTDWELGASYCQKWPIDYVPESLVKVYINHCYERATDIIHKKNSDLFKKRVSMHLFLLDKYKDTFDKKPSYRAHNYSRISYFSFKTGMYLDALYYFVKFLTCKILKYVFRK